jgi:hypothetical protein
MLCLDARELSKHQLLERGQLNKGLQAACIKLAVTAKGSSNSIDSNDKCATPAEKLCQ